MNREPDWETYPKDNAWTASRAITGLVVIVTQGYAHLKDVGVVGHPEELAGLAQADAVDRGQVVTAREDAHMSELFLCEDVPQEAAAAQVVLVNLQTVALLIHLQNHLGDMFLE